MDVDEELREVERTGEIVLGSNETLEVAKSGESELIALSMSCPRDVEEKIRKHARENEIPLYLYQGSAKDLGLALGKPFAVSVLGVIESGDSSILEFGEVIGED